MKPKIRLKRGQRGWFAAGAGLEAGAGRAQWTRPSRCSSTCACGLSGPRAA